MTETTRPMRIIQVDYTCDKCGIGTMRHDGNVFMTYPPQYPHTCDNCGHTAIFRNSYPAIRYEPADPAVTPAAEPAAAPDRPLWVEMRDVYSDPDRIYWSGHGFARELRVVADWLERRWPQGPDMHPCVCAAWLRAEAERAERTET